MAYIIFISAIAAIGGFLFGFDSGVINGTVTALGKAFNSDAVATGFNVASVLLGCAVGALCAGPAADKYGRKPVMLLTALVFAISAWGSGDADTASAFIWYRLLGGLGIGAASVLAPAYISEVAPPAFRGRLATLQQLAIVLGLFNCRCCWRCRSRVLVGTSGVALDVLDGVSAVSFVSAWGVAYSGIATVFGGSRSHS
jgi:SP family sugar:H+ symporter-like MFS transporter